jgi:hypothetical protein
LEPLVDIGGRVRDEGRGPFLVERGTFVTLKNLLERVREGAMADVV